MYALVLFASSLFGTIVTIVGLRTRATRRSKQFGVLFEAGQIVWGGQVRWRSGRRWGASGSITLSSAGLLTWTPDKPSLKRGSKMTTWNIADVSISLERTPRDITGVVYNQYRVASSEASGRFGMFHEVGSPPTGQDGSE